jgi:hypothetical protein
MPSYSRLEAIDDEGYDDEGYDDEGTDDEGVMDVLGGILNPAAAIGNLVGGLFGGGAPRPPLQRVSAPPAGGGVSTATLNTPQGSATLRLPETVVTRSDFDTGIRTLQDAVNAAQLVLQKPTPCGRGWLRSCRTVSATSASCALS